MKTVKVTVTKAACFGETDNRTQSWSGTRSQVLRKVIAAETERAPDKVSEKSVRSLQYGTLKSALKWLNDRDYPARVWESEPPL